MVRDRESDSRFCQLYDHDRLLYSHICTYELCIINRNCCSLCLKNGIHNHQQPNNNHIMDQKSFQEKVKKDQKKFQKEFSNNWEAINTEQFLWQFLQNLKKLKKEIEELEEKVKLQLNMLTTRDLCSYFDNPRQCQTKIDEETLNRWIRNELDFEVGQLQDPINRIQQQINRELLNLNDFLENRPCQTLQQRKYEIQQIKIDCSDQAIISNNERYLVYNNNKTIRIYDIKLNKISKSIFKRNRFTLFQFTIDSQYLFALDSRSILYGFFASKDFKQFYKQQIHRNRIQLIKIIQNQIIIIQEDGSILKTDFLTKCCTFKQETKYSRDYRILDYEPLKDLLIKTSRQTIQIWDCQNQSLLVNFVPECDFYRVEFVNNQQNILCLHHEGNLFKYKVDYQNQQLVKLDEYYYDKLIGFQQINDQNLLLIFEQCYRVVNNEGELVSTIYHFFDFDEYHYRFETSSHSLNYIAYSQRSRDVLKELYLIKALK